MSHLSKGSMEKLQELSSEITIKFNFKFEDDMFETEEEVVSDLPQISSLDVEIEVDKVQGVQFGSIIGTAAPPKEGDFPQADPEAKVDSEKFLADFLKEAGTSRKTDAPSKND